MFLQDPMKNESWDVYGAVHVYIMFLDIDDLLTILSIQIHRVYYILKHGYVIQVSIIQPFFDLYSGNRLASILFCPLNYTNSWIVWRSSQYWMCNVYRYTIHSNHKCQYWCPTYVFPGWYVVRWSWIPVVYPARRCDFWWDSTRSMLGEFDVPKHEVTRPSKLSKDARSSKVAWKGTRGARHLMPMHGLCQLVYSTWKFAPNVSPNTCLNERLIARFQPLEGVDTQSMIVATNKTISITLVHNLLSTIAYVYIYMA